MKPASLAEIRRELKNRDPKELAELCLRLGRFKKDNKELLTYLLFEAHHESAYVETVKYDIDELMAEVNTNHIYYAKKGLQKILRQLNKNIRYSGNKQTEVEVLLYFCQSINDSDIAIEKSAVLTNMYERQKVKIQKALASLHEDIQADYMHELESL
jgi:Zn finger protein HypA/HybF involved in hydrogenase expression